MAHRQTNPARRCLRRAVILVVLGLSTSVPSSCFLIDEHVLTVQNETADAVEGLAVRIKTKETSVPRLAPGASAVIRMRINAESHWEVYSVHGDTRTLLGVCGYTGTIPGRPTEFTLRLVSESADPPPDCVVNVG